MDHSPQPFFRRLRGELLALLLLVPLAVIFGIVLIRMPNTAKRNESAVSASPTANASPLPSRAPTPSSSLPSPATVERATVSLTIAAASSTVAHTVPITENITVAEVLSTAKERGNIQLVTKDFGPPLGLFVESINGVANDPAAELYWHLYINDQRSPLGASSARVRAGDRIRWSLERAHEEK